MSKLSTEQIQELQKYDKNRRGDFYKHLLEQGLYSTSMLFGAINVIRQQNGRSPYKTFNGMRATLDQNGIKPVMVGRMAWWNAEETINALTNLLYMRKEASLDYGVLVNSDEVQNGEWQDLGRCHVITNIPKRRIVRFGNNYPNKIRVTPRKTRLYHLPSLREWADWRQPKWIRDRYGALFLHHLLKTRKTKNADPDGITSYELVYCPEFSHL